MIKLLITMVLFLALTSLKTNAALTEEKYLMQRLDHFDTENSGTWMMRYFANEAYYQQGGPIFIYVGGDYQIGTYWLEHGHMHDIAMDLNGILIGSEMRFFGLNRPTPNVSSENLIFLSTEQVLADLAHLIDHLKSEDARLSDAKVVLVGTMFGGNLATWFSVEYPQHVAGVWSSSSFVEARLNFAEYFEAIGRDIREFGSDECYRRIWRSFRTIQNLVEGSRSILMNEMFNLCHPLNVTEDLEVQQFFESVAEEISIGILNGGYRYVADMCQALSRPEITNDLIAFSEWFLLEHRPTGCFEQTFQEKIDFLSESEWNSFSVISGRRQFNYLMCSEYGWFTTTESEDQPFGSRIHMNYFTEICRSVFGDWIIENMHDNVNLTNTRFGGSLPSIRNAFFTNGGLDPHRIINVQNDIGDTVEARTLPLYGHSTDLYSLSDNDSPAVRDAKLRVRQLITQWLEE